MGEQRDSMEIDRENNHYNHEKTFSSNQITAYKKFWKIVPLKAFKCDELNESNKIDDQDDTEIMTNEWLLETPEDLPDWIWIPCPMGRRSLVVASNGETRAYHSKGFQRAKFQSILPNGNYLFNYDQENRKESNKQTILDCVLNFESKTCYVLDLIKWKGYNY